MTATTTGDAFEYVTGSLRGDDRTQFEIKLKNSHELQIEVRFWEEQLMTLNTPDHEVMPKPETWEAIQRNIQHRINHKEAWAWFKSWQSWSLATVFGLLMLAMVSVFVTRSGGGINADYVAVLTDAEGAARLTTITESGGNTLWLQWDDIVIDDEESLQLWAVSERDGQSRSLAVFEQSTPSTIALTETTLRLIRDSSHLVLTKEELGGSPIDEPSDLVLAQGVCVRLQSSVDPS